MKKFTKVLILASVILFVSGYQTTMSAKETVYQTKDVKVGM
ncbi:MULTISPECIES: hypothetical protein [Bacillus]|nr:MULTISPECIES: hypothetical protein [Bacillus]MEC1043172.1 hypothetical protein [Bacillus altitudinis]MEC1092476.1 hypothetical protein [Bacillus altitudinis]MEC1143689.1 hypothetical protein [Bacillus altitudinis]